MSNLQIPACAGMTHRKFRSGKVRVIAGITLVTSLRNASNYEKNL